MDFVVQYDEPRSPRPVCCPFLCRQSGEDEVGEAGFFLVLIQTILVRVTDEHTGQFKQLDGLVAFKVGGQVVVFGAEGKLIAVVPVRPVAAEDVQLMQVVGYEKV